MANEKLVEVNNLSKSFSVRRGFFFSKSIAELKAVDNINFDIAPGETLGLVGESGCGKSTCGRLIVRLLEPTSGTVYFQGKDIFGLDKKELIDLRWKMQIVFQDPLSSLNPRKTIAETIAYPLRVTKTFSEHALWEQIKELLDRVGLIPDQANRYPHQFSGGQRQRVGIARALAVEPEFIVLDEPVSSLDVSVQAQIINLLISLQDEFDLSYFFISHDLNVVEHLSDRIAVMYLGKIVELTGKELHGRMKGNGGLHPFSETGSLTITVVPRPRSLLMRISPPCLRTTHWDRVRPIPSLSGPRLE